MLLMAANEEHSQATSLSVRGESVQYHLFERDERDMMAKHLKMTPRLKDCLLDREVLDRDSIEQLEFENRQPVNYAAPGEATDHMQVSKMLELIDRQPGDRFLLRLNFDQALVDSGQKDVLEEYFNSYVPVDRLHVVDASHALSILNQTTRREKPVPALRLQRGQQVALTSDVRMTPRLKECLVFRGLLDRDSLEEIESLARQGATDRVQAAKMLELLERQPDEKLVPFCQTLVDSGQKDIVQNYLKGVSVDRYNVVDYRTRFESWRKSCMWFKCEERVALTRSIKMSPRLKECLVFRGLLDRDSLEEIESLARHGATDRAQVAKMLDLLERQPRGALVPFGQAVVDSGQQDTIQEYLKNKYVTIDRYNIVHWSDFEYEPWCECASVGCESPELFREAFCGKRDALATEIRLTPTLKAWLRDNGLLKKLSMQQLEALEKAGKPQHKLIHDLLKCLENHPNERFLPFIKALVDDDQKQLVRKYFSGCVSLEKDGQVKLRGCVPKDPADDNADIVHQIMRLRAKPKPFTDEFRSAFNGIKGKLEQKIDVVNTRILTKLEDLGIIQEAHVQTIQSKANNAEAVETLLSILSGRSDSLFPYFCEALYEADLGHVVEEFWPDYSR